MSITRTLIDVVINYVGKLDKVDRVIVIEAPTGYGKSVGAPLIAALNYKNNFSFNFIHILPLRAIVEDLYLCKYLAVFKNSIDRCRRPPPKAFHNALKAMDVTEADIAYQMGFDYMIRGVGRKEPTYDAKIVISTLDSFAYNFLRMPVTEISKEVKHYAIPRTRIFTSSIFLDEVHMLKRFEDEYSERILTLLKILIEFSIKTSTPLVMASATLWSRFRDVIKSWSSDKITFFTLSNRDEKFGSTIYVRDREFEDFAKSIKWTTKILDEENLVAQAMEHVKSGERVLIVRDTIKSAIDTYSALDLSQGEKILIHGKLCLEDREKALENIETAKVVVATPIIEAGVDWDFDVGFRDATNIPSMIQVFGRVCRSRRDCNASVYLIKTRDSIEELIEYVRRGVYIDWRIPYNYTMNWGEARGYTEVLELIQTEIGIPQDIEAIFKALTYPITVPSSYINKVLRDFNYSVLRKPLAQFYVNGYHRLEAERDVYRIILGTLPYTLELAENLLKCLEGYVCVVDQYGDIVVERIKEGIMHVNGQEYADLYRRCLEFAARSMGRMVFSGFVVKENCYRRGIGLGE